MDTNPSYNGLSLDLAYSLRSAACPICGHPFERRPVICPSCEAPHHHDCWQYNEGCSTYGCVERARRVRSIGGIHRAGLAAALRLPVPSTERRRFLGRPSEEAQVLAALVALAALFQSTLIGAGILVAIAGIVLLVSALASDAYLLDLVSGDFRCTKRLFGRPVLTLPVCDLADVAYLDVEPDGGGGGEGRNLVCTLKSGAKVVLVSGFEATGTQGLAVDRFCRRVTASTQIGLGAQPRKISPIAEAMAEALARHETPPGLRGRPLL